MLAGPGGEQRFVLWRKSLLHPGWSSTGPPATYAGVTMVDVAAELLGLSTLWLGTDFFRNCTDHWGDAPLALSAMPRSAADLHR